MLKRKYYCLIAGLPDLLLNENKSNFSGSDFRIELRQQLDKEDFELVQSIYFQADNDNLLSQLFQTTTSFNPNGTLPKDFLNPENEVPIRLPEYMNQFQYQLKIKEAKKTDVNTENLLQSLFYEHLLKIKNKFLNNWFKFELNTKNIFTAFNCKRFGYEPELHLISTSQNSALVQLLQNAPLKHELFEEEVPFAEQIFRIAESDKCSLDKEKSMDKIKWDYLDEYTFFHYFTIEKILSFLLKLTIIERWIKLDPKTGEILLNQLINELKTSYEFPAEFNVIK